MSPTPPHSDPTAIPPQALVAALRRLLRPLVRLLLSNQVTYPFLANQAVVFTKTFNSWHAVRPMTGADSQAMRRSLTINIEAS